MTFWNFPYFRKTFLDQSLWLFIRVRWWCHTLTKFFNTFHLLKMAKISLSGKLSKSVRPIYPKKWEIISVPRYFNTWIYYTCVCQKLMSFTFSCICVINCVSLTSAPHPIEYSSGLVTQCFPKIWEISKIHN